MVAFATIINIFSRQTMTSFMKYINIISRCANQYRTDRLAGSGLNGCQCIYILSVCRDPGISQDKLARSIYINKSNVTRQLIALEQNGYVERRISAADRRVTEVYPTRKAEDILPEILRLFQEWNAMLTDGFTDDEKEILLELLGRIAAKASSYADGKDCSK
jgi:MarR family transcriptional regulator for hemolysin